MSSPATGPSVRLLDVTMPPGPEWMGKSTAFHAGRLPFGRSVEPASPAGRRPCRRRSKPDHAGAGLANAAASGAMREMEEVQAAAQALGLEVSTSRIRRAEDVAAVFEMPNRRADALYVCSDPFVTVNQVRINSLALGARLPTMHGIREHVQTGGLMSYGTNFPDLFRRAGDYVDKILRGAKPADLPVEQPTKFDFVVNLITAKAIGLTVSPMLLARADEVIE